MLLCYYNGADAAEVVEGGRGLPRVMAVAAGGFRGAQRLRGMIR